MAKKSAMERNKKRQRLTARDLEKRKALKEIAEDRSLPMEDRFGARLKLAKLPRNGAAVRVRAWRTKGGQRICVHWINYRQVENLDDEVPIEQGPFDVTLRIPTGARVHRLQGLDPEDGETSENLDFHQEGSEIRFTVQQLIVYGIAVVHLKDA